MSSIANSVNFINEFVSRAHDFVYGVKCDKSQYADFAVCEQQTVNLKMRRHREHENENKNKNKSKRRKDRQRV